MSYVAVSLKILLFLLYAVHDAYTHNFKSLHIRDRNHTELSSPSEEELQQTHGSSLTENETAW